MRRNRSAADSDAPSGAVATLAGNIRDLYVAAYRRHKEHVTGVASNYGSTHMARWDGGRDSSGVYHEPIWPKIAQFVLANKIDPQRLIGTMFSTWKAVEPPFPSTLLSRATVEKYQTNAVNRPKQLSTLLAQQTQQFELLLYRQMQMFPRFSMKTAAETVLGDTHEDFSPLFRYCVGSRLGCTALCERFRADAKYQLIFSLDAYDASWGRLIPMELMQEAKDVVGSQRANLRQQS